MRKQQGTVDNESEVKQTSTHIVHEVTICKTWESSHNDYNRRNSCWSPTCTLNNIRWEAQEDLSKSILEAYLSKQSS